MELHGRDIGRRNRWKRETKFILAVFPYRNPENPTAHRNVRSKGPSVSRWDSGYAARPGCRADAIWPNDPAAIDIHRWVGERHHLICSRSMFSCAGTAAKGSSAISYSRVTKP